jgi:hypothetical protein
MLAGFANQTAHLEVNRLLGLFLFHQILQTDGFLLCRGTSISYGTIFLLLVSLIGLGALLGARTQFFLFCKEEATPTKSEKPFLFAIKPRAFSYSNHNT